MRNHIARREAVIIETRLRVQTLRAIYDAITDLRTSIDPATDTVLDVFTVELRTLDEQITFEMEHVAYLEKLIIEDSVA